MQPLQQFTTQLNEIQQSVSALATAQAAMMNHMMACNPMLQMQPPFFTRASNASSYKFPVSHCPSTSPHQCRQHNESSDDVQFYEKLFFILAYMCCISNSFLRSTVFLNFIPPPTPPPQKDISIT